jgi:DNA-binding transcriptional MerR regulator
VGQPEGKQYRTREFARLGGVTVRTLQHYDRVGALRPRRSQSGYRLYGDSDLAALQLIRVLKFAGVPLKAIGTLRCGGSPKLLRTLAAQRTVLQARRDLADQALGALTALERAIMSGDPLDGRILMPIVQSIDPKNENDRATQYAHQFDAKIERLKGNLGRLKEWAALYRDIEAAMDEAPSSARAQELAARWTALGSPPTAFDPQMMSSMRAAFSSVFASEAGQAKTVLPILANAKVPEFIEKALATRRQ